MQRLIDDTLHGRQITGNGDSCFVSNEAGIELLNYEVDVVVHLEAAMRQIDSTIREGVAERPHSAGLGYVIGGFLVNAARHDPTRAVTVIDTLCPVLVRECLVNMLVFFRKMEAGYNFSIALPSEYRDFAKVHCSSDDQHIAEAARRVIERIEQ